MDKRLQASGMLSRKGNAVALGIDPDAYPTETLFDVLNALPMPVFVYEPDGDAQLPVFMNQKCLDMLEADSLGDAVAYCGGCFTNYILPEERELVKSKDRRAAASVGKTLSYEYHITTKKHRHRLIRVLSTARTGTDGSTLVVNLTVGLGARPEVEEIDMLDPVTGLISMQSFFQVMGRWRKKYSPEKDGSELAVIYIDIVNFRLINTKQGIAAGDAFLKSFGDSLRAVFPVNPISRFDVDHFAILMHSDNMEAKAASVRDVFQQKAPAGVGISMGACVWDDRDLSPEAVCNRAKAACDDGRKHVNTLISVYDEKMGKSIELSEYVVSNIDQAIGKGWICVFYQPIIRSASGSLCGVEALARWDDPDRGMLPPAAFIGPLENSQQIWKLDLCVIEQAIGKIAERARRGLTVIPVSVNLSRTDFLCCDIFAKIEALVKEYGIARSMLHIEVTESAVAAQDSAVISALARFRRAGYEVWMDDFGSGYSSLNLLKDYDFDVLKLDMAFLHKDTERSRKIISSVVAMDKRIGIRTLAEGVETAEQAEFLRSIGCSKMQGYHFGKPLPFDQMLAHCLDEGIAIEGAKQKVFYDAAAYVDFLSDTALILFDYWNGEFRILQMNEQAKSMIKWYGADDSKDFEDAVNEWNRTSSNALSTAMRYAIQTGKAGEQAVSFNGKDMLFRFRAISQVDGHNLIVANYYDVSRRMMEMANMAMATASILEFYRNVFYIDLGSKTLQSLRFGNNISGADDLEMMPIRNADGSYAPLLPKIFDLDCERYQAFIDLNTLRERLDQAQGEVLRTVFRTLGVNGKYQWMEHMLVYEHGSDRKRVVYGIRPLNIESLSKEIDVVQNSSYAAPFEQSENAGTSLWLSLMPYLPLKLFWKDKDRKFLGASKAFLDYYGFDYAKEILGKTDDDLGWHPDEEQYRDIERQVLETGAVSRDVSGKCIRNGVGRNIRATKWPIYQDGEIVGLMGYFREETEGEHAIDALSGGAPAEPRQMDRIELFIEDFLAFEADYNLNHRTFGVIQTLVPEIERAADQYGSDVLSQVNDTLDDAVLGAVGRMGSVVRLEAGRYAVLCKYRSRAELQATAERVQSALEAIHKIGDYDFTLFAETKVSYAEELSAFLKRLSEELFEGEIHNADLSEDRRTCSMEAVHRLLDAAPFGCYALKPDHTIVYWNHEAERLLGYSLSGMIGRRCTEMPLRCSYTSGEAIPLDQCPAIYALATGEPKSVQMFMRGKDGKDLLIRNTLVPMRDDEGKITRIVSFFIPLADESYEPSLVRRIYEAATKDPVTGLPGRRYMEACIEDALELYHRTGRAFAILFADIDGFHEVNNRYGHKMGDRLLASFGSALREHGRKTDAFCRWGGDEFVGILQLKDTEDIKGAAQRFLKVAEGAEAAMGSHEASCRVSIGITAVRKGDDQKSVVDRADRYMFIAKKRHSDRIVTDYSKEAAGLDEER